MKPLIVWCILCLVWGSTWIFIKIGLDDLPPISFAATRFLVSVIILIPIIYSQKLEFPKTSKEWKIIVISGILQFFFNYGLLFWGEQFISSGLAAVLQAIIPAFGLILAKFYLPDEQITLKKIIAILLGLFGLIIIFWEQLRFGGILAFWGSLAVVVGAFCASYASVLTKTYGANSNPATLVCAQMFVGLIPLSILGFIKEGNPFNFHWTGMALLSVFYLAIIGSIIAFWLYYWLLRKMDVTKAMMISFVTPLMAIFIGAIYRNEKLEIQTVFGAILILGSVLLILIKWKKEKAYS
ncbi:MAG: DMT family transporter [Pyrinomonadaceae bacterium]|nr:DMT family transporter [Pyrinomonadaceae bacterium]